VLWADAAGDIIYPTNAAPSVQISAPTTNLTAGTDSAFSASASDPDGSIAEYVWNFGDGTATTNGPTLTNITHRFLFSGTYTVTVTAKDNSGATNGWVPASIDVSVTGTAGAEHHILIDFGTTVTTGNWNNVTANTLGVQMTNMVTDAGLSVGIGLELTDVFQELRTGNTVAGTLYPETARDYARLVSPDLTGAFKLTGLDTNLTYDLTFYGGCSLAYGPTTRYTTGATNASLTHYNNLNNTVTLALIHPATNGTITISVDNDGLGSGILNVMEIRYVIPDSQPSTDDDSDGLPNDWETQYFGGATNANPDALAANGINTLLETYIAGLDPTDTNARFILSNIVPLQWSAVSGRVYSIYWTSNLLSSFQALETNVVGGGFTDTVHSAEEQGFYQIKVNLE
jgi:hypothetical protein